jgi:Fur family ferric uptake transcriptional regulator
VYLIERPFHQAMGSEEKILEQLRLAGYRITRPRRAVVQALMEKKGHQSPSEVHARARTYCSTIGLVTVYRTLDLLTAMGFARRIHTEDGCNGYVNATQGHRHHLICRICGAAIEFEGCDLSGFFDRIGRATGYRVEEHLLELVGLCPTCQTPRCRDGGPGRYGDTDGCRLA